MDITSKMRNKVTKFRKFECNQILSKNAVMLT